MQKINFSPSGQPGFWCPAFRSSTDSTFSPLLFAFPKSWWKRVKKLKKSILTSKQSGEQLLAGCNTQHWFLLHNEHKHLLNVCLSKQKYCFILIKNGFCFFQIGLRSADQILEYNGVDLRQATAEQAAYELAKPAEKVSILVQYNPESKLDHFIFETLLQFVKQDCYLVFEISGQRN